MKEDEEMERAKTVARDIISKGKREDGIKAMRTGQVTVFIVAALFIITTVYFYSIDIPEIYIGIFAAVSVLYIVLGILFYKNPFLISITALVIYLIPHIISFVLEPASFYKGIVIKVLIIVALVRSVISSKKYQDNIKTPVVDNDILDSGI